ncbi:CDP-archaeol synthase [Bradyrhizobium sp.]|uniref:CDP-archaeol synthase n=1 Tax=Bradyrhizobium sp. TaxID=376 RepID=UPI00239CB0BF|nr:CDP-archaeol synthase [Bradyrhizobium sp.]MDE2375947.1 CDP-archaeol synthase [Bradyrhizobium sp.]
MQTAVILKLLVLLAVANGMPVIAKRLLGERLARPLDGGATFVDGRPLFGASKTLRGFVSAVAAASLAAPLLGLTPGTGFAIGAGAMAGDLLSSFIKRRLGFALSSRATGLDQIPESLIPALLCWRDLSLTAIDVAVAVGIFLVGEILASRLLFWMHIRDRPY